MPRPTRENLVRYAQEANEEQLFSHRGVVAVGTGYRQRDGEITDEVCVQVFVQHKLPLDQLAAAETVPERVPGFEGRAVRTDVIAAPIFDAQQDTARYRPVEAGTSIGPEASVSAGTLGGWATDDTDDAIVLVSNNHVISNLDTEPVLRRIVQPGRLDGGALPGDVIGRLKRHQVLNTVANPPTGIVPTSVVDAAIGETDPDVDIDHGVVDIGPAIYETREPALNMNVQKRGRTTRLTQNGRITTVGATFATTYLNRTRISRIQNSFLITSTDGNQFSAAGDSGSLVFDQAEGELDATRPVVGLLYGGGTLGDGTPVTVANDINAVFGALDLSTVCTGIGRAIIRAIFGGAGAVAQGRAISGPPIASQAFSSERQLRRLRRQLAASDVGAAVDELITREAARVGRIIARDDEAFSAAVGAFAPLRDWMSRGELLQVPIDDELLGAVERLTNVLSRHDSRLAKQLNVLPRLAKQLRGETIESVLKLTNAQMNKR